MNILRSVLAVSKHRGWLDKEFVEYEIAAIVSAAITRNAILSTLDRFTISAIRPKVPGETACLRSSYVAQTSSYRRAYIRWSFRARARFQGADNKYKQTPAVALMFRIICLPVTVTPLGTRMYAALEMRRGTVIFVKPSSAVSTFTGVCYNGRAVEKRHKRVRDCPIIRWNSELNPAAFAPSNVRQGRFTARRNRWLPREKRD